MCQIVLIELLLECLQMFFDVKVIIHQLVFYYRILLLNLGLDLINFALNGLHGPVSMVV